MSSLKVQVYNGLTGPVYFDINGMRANYTIDIHMIAMNMPITKVSIHV